MSRRGLRILIPWLLSSAIAITLSACGSDSTNGPGKDNTPPAAITDLHVDSITGGAVYLSWTASGDDGNTGTAASYDLRYDADSMTLIDGWSTAMAADNVHSPRQAGTKESLELTEPPPGMAYFFAIKASDEAGNISGISNIAAHVLRLVIPDMQSTDCSAFAVTVTVEGFSRVAGLEIHIQYNSQQATYDSVNSTHISGATVNEDNGVIHFVWADISEITSLSDSDTLVTIHLSDLSGSCPFSFEPNTEVVDAEGNPFVLDLIDGTAECMEP